MSKGLFTVGQTYTFTSTVKDLNWADGEVTVILEYGDEFASVDGDEPMYRVRTFNNREIDVYESELTQ